MKVVEQTVYLSGDPGFTLVKINEPWPLTGWSRVIIGGEEMRVMPMSGKADTSFCVKGHRDVKGKEVVFV